MHERGRNVYEGIMKNQHSSRKMLLYLRKGESLQEVQVTYKWNKLHKQEVPLLNLLQKLALYKA